MTALSGPVRLWEARCVPLAYDPFLWLGERKVMAALRREVVGGAGGRVLELGAGTGLNIPHYGDGVRELVLTEPEPAMAQRLQRRAERAPAPARVVPASAERLPFNNTSFDNVVVTLTLCTVADPAAALQEARRVLVDGGRLLLIEHVRADEGSALERWQHCLDQPWRVFASGCRCHQDTLRLLHEAGFATPAIRQERWRGMPPIVRPLAYGEAVAV
ncbi:MAG: class I SAM-dependent methyltransferase [Solirubrobacteraceae bacterium]